MKRISNCWKPLDPATPILYLDLDGVVHHEDVYMNTAGDVFIDPLVMAQGFTLFQWAPALVEQLAQRPAVKIILSTSWVRKLGMKYTLNALGVELAARVVGSTFEASIDGADDDALERFVKRSRGEQIEHDAERRGVENWIALDDDVKDWPGESIERLVKCAGQRGISDAGTFSDIVKHLDTLESLASKRFHPSVSGLSYVSPRPSIRTALKLC